MAKITDPVIEQEAIDWVIRLCDPAPADWQAFTIWLEASPAHSQAYDIVALSDADLVRNLKPFDMRSEPEVANDNRPRSLQRYAGIAAALLVTVFAYPTYQLVFPAYSVETGAGEQRIINLDDGSVIALNGESKVTIDKSDGRSITLDAGEAEFTVAHDENRPFTVVANGNIIQDVGTKFNIALLKEQTEVAVSLGSVIFNPRGDYTLLKAGDILQANKFGGKPVIRKANPETMAGWRSGRLNYQAAPFQRIAEDLSRLLGKRVTVAPNLATRKFSGSLAVDGKDPKAMDNIILLLGVKATANAEEWQLTAQ